MHLFARTIRISPGLLITGSILLLMIGYFSRGHRLGREADSSGSARESTKVRSAGSLHSQANDRVDDRPARGDSTGNTRSARTPMTDAALMAAVGNAAVTSNRHRKAKLIMDLLQHVTAANAKDVFLALGVAQDSGSEISQEIWDNVWDRWGAVDGPAALSFLTDHMKHSSDMDAVTAAEAMLAVNRQGLADWLAANQATSGDNKYWMAAFATLCSADAAADLQGATQHMLAEVDSPELRRRCFQSLCDQAVLSGSIAGLTDYFGTVPENFRVDAFGSTLWRLIIADPTAARDWYSSQADKSWKDDFHTPHMVNLLADEDAPGTAQWAATLPLTPPSGDARRTPIYISAKAWAGRDPAATAAWIITNKGQSWAGIAAQAAIAKASNNLDPQVTLTLQEIAKP